VPFGNRAILFAIGAITVLNIATTAVMISRRSAAPDHGGSAKPAEDDHLALGTRAVVLIVAAFVLLPAVNATVTSIMTSIMTLFVTETMRIDVIWAGIALGVAAGLEVPALILIGRLSLRFSSLRLIVTGCVAGIAYYVAMAYVTGPVMLIALQPLNAWCFAAIAGVGLTLFQQIIPRPGLSTGLYMNTRRVGAIVSGPIIALGSTTALGNRGIFLACGFLIVLALIVIATAARQRESRPTADLPRVPPGAHPEVRTSDDQTPGTQ
jgi:MFS transporter, SET family, sugar efflux transporter